MSGKWVGNLKHMRRDLHPQFPLMCVRRSGRGPRASHVPVSPTTPARSAVPSFLQSRRSHLHLPHLLLRPKYYNNYYLMIFSFDAGSGLAPNHHHLLRISALITPIFVIDFDFVNDQPRSTAVPHVIPIASLLFFPPPHHCVDRSEPYDHGVARGNATAESTRIDAI